MSIIQSEEEFGKSDLKFGDLDTVLYIAELIAKREGIGDLLAEGTKKAAARIGKGSEGFAMHVKGLEVSGYDSRNAYANMLGYMTADVGGHHNRSWGVTHDLAVGRRKVATKAEKVVELQHIRPLFDTLGVCRLPWIELELDVEKYATIFSLLTGIAYTWQDLMKISERVFNLTRSFNFREIPDFGRQWDYPPQRWYKEEVPSGPSKGAVATIKDIEQLLDNYYAIRGWDSNGKPAREKLQALGLDFVI